MPGHKNGVSAFEEQGRSDLPWYGLTQLCVSEAAPVAPAVVARPTITEANSQPLGAPSQV